MGGAGGQVELAVLGAKAQAHRIYAVKFYKASMGYEQEVTPETTLSALLILHGETKAQKRRETSPGSYSHY